MADIQGKLRGINQMLNTAVSATRSAGRIARGGSASGKPSSANPNYDGVSQFGARSASNMRANIAQSKHNSMLKNEAATAKNQAAAKTAQASKARNNKFNADFEAMKQHSPIHKALNNKQRWR
mgnify:CR=1 FL=1